MRFQEFSFYEFGPDTPEETSFLRSSFTDQPVWSRKIFSDEDLIPWRKMDPSLETAAGAGVYQGIVELDEVAEFYRTRKLNAYKEQLNDFAFMEDRLDELSRMIESYIDEAKKAYKEDRKDD